MRSLNSTVGSKKCNADIELLNGVNQWKLTPGVNGFISIYIYISTHAAVLEHKTYQLID
jgi:hypothetical protein